MKNIGLICKKKTQFIAEFQEFLSSKNIEVVCMRQKSTPLLPSFVSKFFFNKQISKLSEKNLIVSFVPDAKADVYFYDSSFSKMSKSTEHLKYAQKVIVQTKRDKYELASKRIVNENNIQIIYPSWTNFECDTQQIKEKYFNQFEIEEHNTKIITHISNNLQKSGVGEFLEIISSLNSENFVAIIAVPQKQKMQLDFVLSSFKSPKNIKSVEILCDEDTKQLLAISDIFVYPAKSKQFANVVPLAMGLKNAVFVTSVNKASEIVDYFATIQGQNDTSTGHKIDALLCSNDLEMIKIQNHEMVLEYEQTKTFEKIYNILETL